MGRGEAFRPFEAFEPRLMFSGGDGLIQRDYWTGVGGNDVTDLTATAAYPESPTGRDTLDALRATAWGGSDQTADWADTYGQRLSGYLVAPETGSYTFWVSGDDAVELRLSTDDRASNYSVIAESYSFTGELEWNKHATQRSAEIELEAGRFYAIEVLHKEGGGGDHLAVGWRKPSDGGGAAPIEVIPGAALSTTLPPLVVADGQVNRDYWTGIGESDLAYLQSQSVYPDAPTGSDTLTSLQAVDWDDPTRTTNWADEYGQRITGYLVAPETGNYTFWLSGDDNSEFYLSTDTAEANRVLLASVPYSTGFLVWDHEASQRSVEVSLTAGESYYLELLHKEGGGGDHLAVGWRRPSDGAGSLPSEIVPGAVLSTRPVVNERLVVQGPDAVQAGESYTLGFSVVGPQSSEVTGWEIDWGDGSPLEVRAASDDEADHVYANAGSYAVTVRALGTSSALVSGPLTVAVTAGAVVSVAGSGSSGLGEAYTLTLDAGPVNATHWVIDWGDGSVQTVDGSPATVDHVFNRGGELNIRAWAFDANSGPPVRALMNGGKAVVEAESPVDQAAGAGSFADQTWDIFEDTAQGGGAYIETTPDRGGNTADTTDGPRQDYTIDFESAGTYYVWVRMWSPSSVSNSVHVGLDGQLVSGGHQGVSGPDNEWHWEETVAGRAAPERVTIDVTSPGVHTLNLWMREDGTRVDRILVTDDAGFTPTGVGPAASPSNFGDAYAAAPLTVTTQEARTLEIQATIRDFNDSHPDFERPQALSEGREVGLVLDRLDADGKPQFNPDTTSFSIENAQSFAQWYRDTPGVNLATTKTIGFLEMSPGSGLFEFNDQDFFPINDELFANQGRSENYHFTMELNSSFTYQGGEVFDFIGDDDLWVFINGRLAVDVGGVHLAEAGSVDLDARAQELGLIVGETYRFDLFFAERHTELSTFRATTSLDLTDDPAAIATLDVSSLNEGETATLMLDVIGTQATGWTIDWGDGSPPQTLAGDATTATHVYADGDAGLVVSAVADTDAGTFAAAPIPLTVSNVAPTLTLSGAPTAAAGDAYTLNLASADPGDDTITQWTIDWGDATPPEVAAGDPDTLTHTFADAGSFTVTATATDEDGTYDANSITVEVSPAPSNAVTLVEDADLITTNATEPGGEAVGFVVPDSPGALRIDFTGLAFDATGNDGDRDVNDAFELLVRAADGSPVLPGIGGLETQFNLTQGRDALTADGVVFEPLGSDAGSVYIDISSLAPGTTLELVARLLNNDRDGDDLSTVTVDLRIDAQQGLYPSTAGTPGAGFTPAGANTSPFGIDYSRLADVTSAFNVTYDTTGYDAEANQLFIALDLLKAGGRAVREDLLVAVRGVRNQTTGADAGAQLAAFDGLLDRPVGGLAAGTPFLRLSSLLERDADGFFVEGGAVDNLLLAFGGLSADERFDFDLVFLGQANAAPAFTSDPYDAEQGAAYPVSLTDGTGTVTRVLEIVANANGNRFDYTPTTADPDDDAVLVSLLTGPDGLTLTPTGDLEWQPTAANVGTHTIRLRATDAFGAFDPANDQVIVLQVLESVANRPPRFTTDPVTAARVGEPYAYDADAFDPDGDTLTYTGTAAYTDADGNVVTLDGSSIDDNFTINSQTGEVMWTPTSDLADRTLRVELQVTDPYGAADNQAYDITVQSSDISDSLELPDLTIDHVDVTGLTWNPQTLTVEGVVAADVTNLGLATVTGDFAVTFFEDLDFDGVYTRGVDRELAVTTVDRALITGDSLTIAAAVSGNTSYAGAIIHAWVDSGNDVNELDETNNHAASYDDCQVEPPTGSFTPVIEWTSSEIDGLANDQALTTPLVADLNKDGFPEVIFVSNFDTFDITAIHRAIAVDGRDGSVLWIYEGIRPDGTTSGVSGGSQPALGDINDDGEIEVLIANDSLGITALNHQGNWLWDSDTNLPNDLRHGAIAISDLNADGTPEIIVGGTVFDNQGRKEWTGNAGQGQVSFGSISTIANIDLSADGSQEVIAGQTIYDHFGNVLYTLEGAPDGLTGIGNFDSDEFPEIVLVANGKIYLFEHTGQAIWDSPVQIPGGPGNERGGAPTIADFDGDNQPEIGVAGADFYVVIENNGSLKWQQPIYDRSSNVTGSSVFDFNGDGRYEVIYSDERNLYVFDGTYGTPLFNPQFNVPSRTALEAPIVADVDADGNAEIVVSGIKSSFSANLPGPTGITVIGDVNDSWAPTRQIWNQHSYHINNINDDGTIPINEEPSWLSHNTYRLNTITDPDFSPLDAPDLIPSYLRINESVAETTYTVRVGNAGSFFSPDDVSVAFYDGDPSMGSTLIGTTTLDRLDVGRWQDISLTATDGPVADLWVVVDDDGTGQGSVRECNEDNNAYSLVEGNTPLPPNTDPVIDSRPVATAVADNSYVYGVEASDSDPNQRLVYELVVGPEGMEIDPTTGRVDWTPDDGDVGTKQVVIRVRDGYGGSDLQSYLLNIVARNDDPAITSFAPAAAKSGVEYVYQVEAADPNGDALAYEVDPVSFDRGVRIGQDGRLTWTPPGVGSVTIGIRVTDGRGGEAIQFFELNVAKADANTPPRITSGIDGLIFLNEAFSFTMTAEDLEDGNSPDPDLIWSIDDASLARGVDIDPLSGLLTWTPRVVGTFTTTVTVTDSQGASSSQVLTLPVNVRPVVNDTPEFTSTPTGPAVNGRSWVYTVTATDPDLDAVTLTLIDAPAWLDQAPGTPGTASSPGTPAELVLTGTPDAGGTYRFVVRADDGRGNTVEQVFDLPVIANAPPIIVEAVQQAGAEAGTAASYNVVAFDPNGDELTFELVSGNGTGGFGAVTDGTESGTRQAALSYTPAPGSDGPQDVVVRVSDGTDSVDHVITLQVTDPGQLPPTASLSAPDFVLLGDTLTTRVEAIDPNEDVLTYAFVDAHGNTFTEFTSADTAEAPVGLSIDPTTGVLSWTPAEGQQTADDGEPYTFTVRVSDGRFAVDLGPAQIRVIETPVGASNPPQFVRAVATATAALDETTGAAPTLNLEFDFIDFDAGSAVSIDYTTVEGGGTGSFDSFNLPGAVSSDPDAPSRATLTFTPDAAGWTVLRVTLTDNDGLTSSRNVVIDVVDPNAVNRPPVASLLARTATAANERFVAQVEASDPNGDELTYGLVFPDPARTPQGLVIDAATGRLSWTPGTDDTTTPDGQPYLYTVTVSDGTETVEIGPVELTVVSRFTNAAPEFMTDPTGVRSSGGDALVYDAQAEDPDGDPVVYTLDDGPAGSSIDRDTGRFVWRPDASVREDQTFEARITATDPYGASATQVIELRFTAGNAAPRITSTPPQPGFGGEDYVYLVEAADADGDAITFSLAGETAGLSITQLTATTARVVWTKPGAGDTRAFEVVATDARGLAGRQAVSLTVGTPGSGNPGDPGTGAPTGGSVDLPPVITSNPVLAVVAGQDYRYRVVAEDPDGDVTYGLKDGAPDWLDIDEDTGVLSGTAPVDAAGQTPRITVTATQAGATAMQSFTLQVTSADAAANNPPVVEPAEGLVAFAGSPFAFDVNARDPEGDAVTFSLVDDQANEFTTLNGVSISGAGRITYDVPAGVVPGDLVLNVLARDARGATSNVQPFTVDVRSAGDDVAPTVGLRANTTRIEVGRDVVFAVEANDDLGIAEVFVTLSAPFLSEPVRLEVGPAGLVRFTPPADAVGQTLTATATAVDTSGNASTAGPLDITVAAPDTAAPVIRIDNVYPGSIIESATTLRGAIYDPETVPGDPDSANLVYTLISAVSAGGQRTVLAEAGTFNGNTVIPGLGDADTEADLAVLSPLQLADGTYKLEFLAQDADGRIVGTQMPVTVESTNAVKLGNFRQTFVDLSVPVAGVPLTVERTYDSVDADVLGDFGYGWSLDILSGRAAVSNLAPDDIISGDSFLGATFDTPWQFGTRLELELPGGERLGFTAVADSLGGGGISGFAGGLISAGTDIFNVVFQPDTDSLGNKLEFLGGGAAGRPLGSENAAAFGLRPGESINSFDVRVDESGTLTTSGTPFNPVSFGADYRLTTRDGRKFTFDSRTGELTQFEDAYGNRVTLDGNQINSFQRGSSDATGGLTITRDPANGNRITRIENVLGFGVNYRYDSFGDLIAVDREVFLDDPATPDVDEYQVVTTSFGYQTPEAAADPDDPTLRAHFLDEIRDDDGVSLAENEYDENGRLRRVSNDAGTDVTVTYDEASRTQTTVDAFGVTSIATYDERGNVQRIEQPTDQYGGQPVVYLFEHDENDNLLSQTDPLGRVTTYTYDNRGRLETVTAPFAPGEDPSDFTTTYTYDDRTDQVATITSPDGRVERREYNAFGDLLRLSDETGYVFQEWDYDDAGRLTREGSPQDGYFLYRYDPLTGQLAETEDPTGDVITSQFDAIGQLTGFVDEDGLNQLFYDGLGREVRADYGDTSIDYTYDGDSPEWSRIESPSIGTVERLLSPAGQLEGWNLANGGEVRYVYDRGRLDQEIDAVGRVTQYRYDDLGRVRRVEDLSTGNFVEYTYDMAGQVVRTADALGNVVETDFDLTDTGRQITTNARGFSVVSDVDGLITTVTEGVTLDPADGSVINTPAARTTRIERDPAGLPLRLVNADGTAVSFQYRNRDVLDDAEQSPTRITDEAGRSRVFTYLDDGRIQTASDLAGNTITLTYDDSDLGDGRLDTITGPTGETVTYGYDDEGRVNAITRRGLGTTTVNTFAPDGEPTSITLPTGEIVTLVYDENGNVESRTTDTGETATFSYNLNDQVESLTDNTGQTQYAYYTAADPQEAGATHIGRLKSITQPNGTSVSYRYDIAGRVRDVTTRASAGDIARTTSYTYDPNGNIETVTDPFGGQTIYTYDSRDRLETRTLPNGVLTTWTFDDRDRLLSLVHTDGGGAVIRSFTYEHPTNATGEPSRITREDGSYVELDYDPANRVAEERYYDPSGTLTETIAYEYDAAGNRTRVVTNGQAAVYSASIESDFLLTTIDAPGTEDDASFTYGPGGVLESITRDGQTWTLGYNSLGQVVRAENDAGRTLTYTYVGEGERVGVTDSDGGTLNYLVAPPAQGLGVAIGHRYLEANASGGLVNGWVYAGENPILRYAADGTISYYLEDASDSIAALTDASGSITRQYAYDAFGSLLTGSDAVEDFGYHAALHDEATGLIDFRLRTYDPATGRFTSVDPVAPSPSEVESYNPYSFSNYNPHLYSDPTGGFSLAELNVTQLINKVSFGLKQVGVNQARRKATKAIKEAAVDFLVDQLTGWLPAPGFEDFVKNKGNLREGGVRLHNGLDSLIGEIPFADKAWLEPSLRQNGTPTRDGFNPGLNVGAREKVKGQTSPDFIFRPDPTGPTDTNKDSYLIGDFKLSVRTLYNDYFDGKKPKRRQWLGITNYAKKHQILPVALFVTWDPGSKSIEKKIEKEGIKNRGVVPIVVSLRPGGKRK